MKRARKLLFLSFSVCLALCALFACAPVGGDEGETPAPEEESYTVMLSAPEGVSILGKNPIKVKKGENAVFSISLGKEYVFSGASEGNYDPASGTFTVENVTEKKRIVLSVEHVGYDTTKQYMYYFHGTDADTSSVEDEKKVWAGTQITVCAGDNDRLFAGWSFSKLGADLSVIVSTEREFTFRLSPEHVNGAAVNLYANYTDQNRLYYDANGGRIQTGTKNMNGNAYYTTSLSGSSVLVTLKQSYLDYCECATAFWDDGTFRRDGYLLKEYNTRADGSGDAYSLGSKVYHVTSGGEYLTLYCIWEPCATATDFTYREVTYARPAGVKRENAPEWVEDGVTITGYHGTGTTLAIPETLGGKTVIGISAGAFRQAGFETLLFPRTLEFVEDGAFVGCTALTTLYFPDSIYSIGNAAFDAATYEGFRHFIVNATMAPRLSDTEWGSMSVKLSRLLASGEKERIVIVAGSSVYQGLGCEYLEALLDDRYRVINFGTARTMNGAFLLEAISQYVHEGDTVLFAPENSTYMMGERELYWKTVYLTEGMYNLWRGVDISGYTNLFDAFCDYNQSYRYIKAPSSYENVVAASKFMNKYGDYQNKSRAYYCEAAGSAGYIDAYYITMNERFKSRFEGDWSNAANQEANKDYTDPSNPTWASITDAYFVETMNRAIGAVKAKGAKICFSFCPVDADKLVEEARSTAHFAAYDSMILSSFAFDGAVGSSVDYVYAHKYFYDNAFHPNDYGRTHRTYQLYRDLCTTLNISSPHALRALGTSFEGCLFERGEMTPAPILR